MERNTLSESTIDYGYITGTTIPRDFLRVKIFEGFVLGNRVSQNKKDYSYEDYTFAFSSEFQWVQDYIRDHFDLKYNKQLIPKIHWGNIYGPLEQSYSRTQINPLNLKNSPDYTWIYGVGVQKDSCELVIEYDDNRRKGRTWHIPLENNKFIIFPSTHRYFISKNKGAQMNVFLSMNCEYV